MDQVRVHLNDDCTVFEVIHNIHPGIVEQLADALSGFPNLVKLSFFSRGMGSEGAIYLAGALPGLRKLTTLSLVDCSIDWYGMMHIAQALPSLLNLTTLRLTTNNIGDEGATRLTQAIGCSVSLVSCHVDTPFRARIDAALRGPRPPHHVTVGLILLRARAKGLTQDERELILRLLEPWFGRYDTDATRARREKALAQ